MAGVYQKQLISKERKPKVEWRERGSNLCERGGETWKIYLTFTKGILVISSVIEARVTHVDKKPSHLTENLDGWRILIDFQR